MQGVRFIIGRPRGKKADAVQAIEFHVHEWTEREARRWLESQGYQSRNLDRAGLWHRYRVRDKSVFVPRTLRAVETGAPETVTMASNSRKKKRTKRRPGRAVARSTKRRRRRSLGKGKVTRTTVNSVKVMQTNARKKPRKKNPRKKRSSRSSTHWTVTFAPSIARVFARALGKTRRREMLRSLRRHPRGGVYVALPTWHGTAGQAQRLARRAQLVLAYALGRRRGSFTQVSAPRVVAVPARRAA